MEADRKGHFLLAELEGSNCENGGELKRAAERVEKKYKIVEEDNDAEMQVAWDDVSGASSDAKAVRAARVEEVNCVRKMGFYTKVPISECFNRTGQKPTSIRWIDLNKGDSVNPNYRSRLVAREINTHKRDDLFAATPPLEALKVILSMTAIQNKGEIIMINDIARASFHAKAKRVVFVQLPPPRGHGRGAKKICAGV